MFIHVVYTHTIMYIIYKDWGLGILRIITQSVSWITFIRSLYCKYRKTTWKNTWKIPFPREEKVLKHMDLLLTDKLKCIGGRFVKRVESEGAPPQNVARCRAEAGYTQPDQGNRWDTDRVRWWCMCRKQHYSEKNVYVNVSENEWIYVIWFFFKKDKKVHVCEKIFK